jgi:hypothetical protein
MTGVQSMTIIPPDRIISLTITLNRREFETAVVHGIEFLHELGEAGLVVPLMPMPDTPEIARDVAILGVQEIIAAMERELRAKDIDNDDIPF